MFDFGIGYSELFLVAVVAIIVIGPKDLPRVLRSLGQMLNKARGMAREFQGHLDTALKDAGLDDVKKDLQSLRNIGNIDPGVKGPATGTSSSGSAGSAALQAAEAKKAETDYIKYFGEPAAVAADKPATDAT